MPGVFTLFCKNIVHKEIKALLELFLENKTSASFLYLVWVSLRYDATH